MKTSGLMITLAALLAPAVLRAEFVSVPVILNVNGLDPAKISCNAGSIAYDTVSGSIHNNACWAAKEIFSRAMKNDFDESYFADGLAGVCGSGCPDMTGFTWNGDISQSRAVVDELKDRIAALGAQARKRGAPFIIISHSWGTVLAMEALAELDRDPAAAGTFTVDKLITMGSPLFTSIAGGYTLYNAATDALICDQGFEQAPRRASSIAYWLNYYASRDKISGRVPLADDNVRVDEDEEYAYLEDHVQTMAAAGIPEAVRDSSNFSLANGTQNWHSSYYKRISVYLNSMQSYMDINVVGKYSGNYFWP